MKIETKYNKGDKVYAITSYHDRPNACPHCGSGMLHMARKMYKITPLLEIIDLALRYFDGSLTVDYLLFDGEENIMLTEDRISSSKNTLTRKMKRLQEKSDKQRAERLKARGIKS